MSSLRFLPDVVTFLSEHFGWTFEFEDPECRTIKIRGRELLEGDVIEALDKYLGAIAARMQHDRDKRMSLFMGGPLNGTSCFYQYGLLYLEDGICTERFIRRVGHAQWAVYKKKRGDSRAWFVGVATSKAKARHGTFITEAAT